MSQPFGELINEYLAWVKATFPGETVEGQIEHLQEEWDELKRSNFQDVDEMADVFGLLVCISCRQDVNLFEAFRRKFEINKNRLWIKGPRGWRHYDCKCTAGNYADECPKHGSGVTIVEP